MNDSHLQSSPYTNWTPDLNLTLPAVHIYDSGEIHGVASILNHDKNNHQQPVAASSTTGSCHDWLDAQHTLFQLANLCAAVSLLTPSSFRHHLLFLRCLLLIAYLLFILWAGLFVCMMDVLMWNCVFFIVDFVHIICLAYNNIPSRFNPNLNELYIKKLKPLRVCRRDFADLCNLGLVVPLRKGGCYSMENITPCGEKISMLLRGRLKVSHDGIFLHSIDPNEFVDSPEFDSVPFHSSSTTEKFQVTITACEECLIISWVIPALRAYLTSNPFLWNVFTNIVGKDISDKLYKIQELLLGGPENVPALFITANSSMVNVRKCLHATDDREESLANVASRSMSEVALNLAEVQDESSGAVETRV